MIKGKDNLQPGKRYWQHKIDTGLISDCSNDFNKSVRDRNNKQKKSRQSKQKRHFS